MYACVCVCVSLCSQQGCSFGKPDEVLERTKEIKVLSVRTQLHINKTEMLNL